MNAYELADAIEDWDTGANYTISIKAGQMLRQQAKCIKEYERVLVLIANDYPELSYDKAKLQNLEHIKWAKEVLQNQALDNLMEWQQEFENSAQEEVDSQEYRRTHEGFSTIIDKVTPQTKPLSDEEIEYYEHLIAKLFNVSIQQKVVGLDRIIRAIEERYGIK